MCKKELFNKIIDLVAYATEISSDDIISKKKDMETVDARSVAVEILYEEGFYPSQIAKMMSRTSASIRYLIANYDNRKKNNKIIEMYEQIVRKEFENN